MSKQKKYNHPPLEEYLQKADIYHPDDTINEEAIYKAAERHIDILRDYVPEKTLRDLQQNLRLCLSLKDWLAAAFCLSTYLGIAAEWLEKYVLQLAADRQAIQCYAKRVYSILEAE